MERVKTTISETELKTLFSWIKSNGHSLYTFTEKIGLSSDYLYIVKKRGTLRTDIKRYLLGLVDGSTSIEKDRYKMNLVNNVIKQNDIKLITNNLGLTLKDLSLELGKKYTYMNSVYKQKRIPEEVLIKFNQLKLEAMCKKGL